MHIVVSSDQLALAEEEIILKMNWSWRVRNTRLLLFAPLPSLDPTLPHGGLRHKKMRTDIKNMYLRICQHMHGAPLHDNPPLRWLGYTTRLTQGLTLLCGLCFRPDFFLCRERHLNGSQANSFFSLTYINMSYMPHKSSTCQIPVWLTKTITPACWVSGCGSGGERCSWIGFYIPALRSTSL